MSSPLFILDGSMHQPNADAAKMKKQGYSAFIAKSSEGQTGRDSAFRHNYASAKAAGMPFAAYHFVTQRPASAQADNCAGMINDKSIPVFLDLERTSYTHPTLSDAEAVARELRKRGYSVPAIYFPHFYWVELGRPTHPRDMVLWQALYPNNRKGYASAVYPHVPSSYWSAQGGVKPTLLQFSDLIHLDGYTLNTWDCSAFEGSIGELRSLHLFKFWDNPPHPPTTAPAFPLSRGNAFGTPSFTSGHGLAKWQQRMHDRGWNIIADDKWGPQTKNTAIAFQHEKHLRVTGMVDEDTWYAAWTTPVI